MNKTILGMLGFLCTPKRTVTLIALLSLMALSVGLTADTYNFYFSKKKEKQKTEESEDKKDDEEESDDSSSKNTKNHTQDKVEAERGQAPIVINNINNNDNTNKNNVTNTPAPVAATASTVATVTPPSDVPQRWRWNLAAVGSAPSGRAPDVGLEVGVNYSLTKYFAWDIYVGAQELNYFHPYAGADFEFLPLRIPVTDTWAFFQMGLLAGGSTLGGVRGNIGSLHIGAKAALNLTESFGIGSTFRINYGYKAVTLGLICQL